MLCLQHFLGTNFNYLTLCGNCPTLTALLAPTSQIFGCSFISNWLPATYTLHCTYNCCNTIIVKLEQLKQAIGRGSSRFGGALNFFKGC